MRGFRIVIALLFASFVVGSAACSGASNANSAVEHAGPSQPADTAVFEETISPNEEYVGSREDVVTYTVRVTQESPNTATVSTASNSGFFKPISYEVVCGDELSADDVSVSWTTLMGSTEPTENDQLAVARVSVRMADGSTDERKVNFINGAIEIIAEAIPGAQRTIPYARRRVTRFTFSAKMTITASSTAR